MAREQTRRQVLRTAPIAALSVGLAGCSGNPNKLAYSVDAVSAEKHTSAVVTGTYGRNGGLLSGGSAAHVELRVSVRPAETEETFEDTVELYLDPPGTEAEFRSEQRLENVSASQVENGDVRVEVLQVDSEVTWQGGAD